MSGLPALSPLLLLLLPSLRRTSPFGTALSGFTNVGSDVGLLLVLELLPFPVADFWPLFEVSEETEDLDSAESWRSIDRLVGDLLPVDGPVLEDLGVCAVLGVVRPVGPEDALRFWLSALVSGAGREGAPPS